MTKHILKTICSVKGLRSVRWRLSASRPRRSVVVGRRSPGRSLSILPAFVGLAPSPARSFAPTLAPSPFRPILPFGRVFVYVFASPDGWLAFHFAIYHGVLVGIARVHVMECYNLRMVRVCILVPVARGTSTRIHSRSRERTRGLF